MQQAQKYESKGMSKRQFSSPTTSLQSAASKTLQQQKMPQKQGTGGRKTDYTDDRNSEVTSSQINNLNSHQFPKQRTEPHNNYNVTNPHFKNEQKSREHFIRDRDLEIQRQQNFMMEELMEKEAKAVELRERLKNIHHFYKVRIQEERNKNIDRSEIFIGIIEELQQIHAQKVQALEKSYVEIQEGDQELGQVDQRMSTINRTINEVIQKSEQIKVQNQALQAQIVKKRQQNDEKQQQLQNLKRQFSERRQTLQHFQKLKLKQNQRNKELLKMMSAVER